MLDMDFARELRQCSVERQAMHSLLATLEQMQAQRLVVGP